jgi:hypothetical protein
VKSGSAAAGQAWGAYLISLKEAPCERFCALLVNGFDLFARNPAS